MENLTQCEIDNGALHTDAVNIVSGIPLVGDMAGKVAGHGACTDIQAVVIAERDRLAEEVGTTVYLGLRWMAEETNDGEQFDYDFTSENCTRALGAETCAVCKGALPGLFITLLALYAQFLGMWFALIRLKDKLNGLGLHLMASMGGLLAFASVNTSPVLFDVKCFDPITEDYNVLTAEHGSSRRLTGFAAVAALVQFCGHCLAQHDPTIPCLEGTPWQWFFGIEGLCCYKEKLPVDRLTSIATEGSCDNDNNAGDTLEMDELRGRGRGSPSPSQMSQDGGDGPLGGSTPTKGGGGGHRQQGRPYSRGNSSDSEGGDGGGGSSLRKPLIKPSGESRFQDGVGAGIKPISLAVVDSSGRGSSAKSSSSGGGGDGSMVSVAGGKELGTSSDACVAVEAPARTAVSGGAKVDEVSEKSGSAASAGEATPPSKSKTVAEVELVDARTSAAASTHLRVEAAPVAAVMAGDGLKEAATPVSPNGAVVAGVVFDESKAPMFAASATAAKGHSRNDSYGSAVTAKAAEPKASPSKRGGSGRKLPESPTSHLASVSASASASATSVTIAARPTRRRGHTRAHSTGHKIDLSKMQQPAFAPSPYKKALTSVAKRALSSLTPPRESSPAAAMLAGTAVAAVGTGTSASAVLSSPSPSEASNAESRRLSLKERRKRSLSDIGPSAVAAAVATLRGSGGVGVSPQSGLSAVEKKKLMGHKRNLSWGSSRILVEANFVEVTAC